MAVTKEFRQVAWDAELADDCRQIVRLALREDLGHAHDWTTLGLVPASARRDARIVARQEGTVAGLEAAELALRELETDLQMRVIAQDGEPVAPGGAIAQLNGSARDLLTTERLILNLVGHLSGVATLTRRYVDAVDGTRARIYDTRKTTPAWRRLEKYAVRCGGGWNHRTGLSAAVMIKDNHLAFAKENGMSPAEAVLQMRRFLQQVLPGDEATMLILEVEVDTEQQLPEVLAVKPDIILLDNMSCDQLARCVRLRDQLAADVQLEASGGVTLSSVRAIAQTGIERISVGALTHSAPNLDLGLDWGT